MARTLWSLLLAAAALATAPAAASAAIVELNTAIGMLEIEGDPADDSIAVGRVGANLVVTGPGVTTTDLDCPGGGGGSVSCPLALVKLISVNLAGGNDAFTSEANVTIPESIAGHEGTDRIRGGSGADVLAGGDGNDTLDGAGGVDDYFGEAGDDTITANDGSAERIACGAGNDIVTNDFTDIIAECERGVDNDGDGFATTVDCNDTSAAIRPGAREVYGNGVDENCNGRDDVNLDADADGFAVPVDCDDRNAAIRPGALEVRGNAVDENCDRRAESWRVVPALVTNRWAFAGSVTRLQALVVRVAPKGAVVTLRCRGSSCPFTRIQRRTVARDLAPVSFSRLFRRARLRPGARLTLTINAAESVGRTFTYTVRRGALPDARIVCRAPGDAKGDPC
jgi:hypothetical protein